MIRRIRFSSFAVKPLFAARATGSTRTCTLPDPAPRARASVRHNRNCRRRTGTARRCQESKASGVPRPGLDRWLMVARRTARAKG
jgi:hypothetical protein